MTNVTKHSVKKNHNQQMFTRHPQQVAALQNLLTQFYDNARVGYSDQSWTQTSLSMKRLSGFLCQTERDMLAKAWSDFYVDENVEKFRTAVEAVRSRV